MNRLSLLIVATIAGGACTRSESVQSAMAADSVPGEDIIAEADLPRVRSQAALGDPIATRRLWRYYSLVENNVDQWLFWLRLGAEQKDCRSMVDYAKQLFYLKNDEIQAGAWAREAKLKGCQKELNGESRLLELADSYSELYSRLEQG